MWAIWESQCGRVASTDFYFTADLAAGKFIDFVVRGALISGGRGGTHPATDKAYTAYHIEFFLPLC